MRPLILALLALLALPVIVLAAPPQSTATVPENPVIVLDPGHGGTEFGAVYTRS